jgi:uncharacterized protein (DUF433 family)
MWWYPVPRGTRDRHLRREDPRDLPRYSTAEAAHYLRLPHATLQTWVSRPSRLQRPSGGSGHQAPDRFPAPVLPELGRGARPQCDPAPSWCLAAAGAEGSPIRRASYAPASAADRGEVPDEWHGPVRRGAGQAHQRVQRGPDGDGHALRASLARVEHDADGLASRLFPFVRGDGKEPKVIVVDPRLSFGRPVVAKTGVPVSIIVGRYRAGEDVAAIAKDYGISVDQTPDAIRTAIPAAA